MAATVTDGSGYKPGRGVYFTHSGFGQIPLRRKSGQNFLPGWETHQLSKKRGPYLCKQSPAGLTEAASFHFST